METVIILIIGALALFLIIKRVFSRAGGPGDCDTPCNCGCSDYSCTYNTSQRAEATDSNQ